MIALAVGDPEATRTVYGVVIGLAVIGVALVVVAIWLFRQTKVDPELLAPLERMDTRLWSRRDPATQRRMLDEVRPEGAEPLHRERAVPAVDEEFEAELPAAAGFDDLKGGVDLSSEEASVASDDGESGSDDEGDADGSEVVAATDDVSSTADDAEADGSEEPAPAVGGSGVEDAGERRDQVGSTDGGPAPDDASDAAVAVGAEDAAVAEADDAERSDGDDTDDQAGVDAGGTAGSDAGLEDDVPQTDGTAAAGDRDSREHDAHGSDEPASEDVGGEPAAEGSDGERRSAAVPAQD